VCRPQIEMYGDYKPKRTVTTPSIHPSQITTQPRKKGKDQRFPRLDLTCASSQSQPNLSRPGSKIPTVTKLTCSLRCDGFMVWAYQSVTKPILTLVPPSNPSPTIQIPSLNPSVFTTKPTLTRVHQTSAYQIQPNLTQHKPPVVM
jgi:hypothetical protein